MVQIKTREGYLASIINSQASIYTKSGILLAKSIPVIQLKATFNTFQVRYMQNCLFLGWEGLKGGGNCNSSTGYKTNKRKNQTNDIKGRISKGIIVSPIELFMQKDDILENTIKKNLSIFREKLIVGEICFDAIKSIEDTEVKSTCDFFGIFSEIMQILRLPEMFFNKNCVFLRYKLSILARYYLVLAKAINTQHNFSTSMIDYIKASIPDIRKHISEDFLPEFSLLLNLFLIENLLEKFNTPINEALKLQMDILLSNHLKKTFNISAAVDYFQTSLKYNRDLVSDMILLELSDCQDCASLLRCMIDRSLNSSWECIGLILIKLASGNEEVGLLGEYLYFSNFDTKDVWKIRGICVEILIQIKAMNMDARVQGVLEEKRKQEDKKQIGKFFEFQQFYEYSVNLYYRSRKEEIPMDYFFNLPKLPPSQCDISHIQLLLKTQHKMFQIRGPSGSGKTVLALNYAYSKLDFYHLIFFIPSGSIRMVHKKFIQLSRRLKLIIQDSLDDMVSSVIRYLEKQPRPFLLIFDNVSSFESIKNCIPKAGHIILISSNDICQLKYDVFPLDDNMARIYLGDYFSSNLCQLLENNYMAIGLAIKLLKNRLTTPETLLETLQTTKGQSGVFTVLLNSISKKIPGSKEFLFSLSLLENFIIPRRLAYEIFKTLRQPVYNLDLLICQLSPFALIDEVKGFCIALNSSFYNFLAGCVEREIHCVNILKQSYFALYAECEFLDSYKEETRVSLLLQKFVGYLNEDYSVDAGTIFFLKGKYDLNIELSPSSAIESFEHAVKCFKGMGKYEEQTKFALGCSYLKNFRALDSIHMFIETIESSLNEQYKFIANAYLVRAYDYIGDSSKIAGIIIHTNDMNFQQLVLPEAVYCTIHGICGLSLNDQDLQEFLLPYSSFLYSRAPSISLILTLLKLAHTFAMKEKWTNCFNYVNLITPLVQTEGSPIPSTKDAILQVLENLVGNIRVKLELMVGSSHRIVALLHLLLSRIYGESKKSSIQKIHLELCLKIRVENFGDSHIFVGDIYYHMGKFYEEVEKNVQKGLEYANMAEMAVLKADGGQFLIYAKIVELLGLLYMRDKDMIKAQEYLEKSLNLKRKILAKSTDNIEISSTIASLARLEHKKNNQSQACELYSQAIDNGVISLKSYRWAKKAFKCSEILNNKQKSLEFQLIIVEQGKILFENTNELYDEYNVAYKLASHCADYTVAKNLALDSYKLLQSLNKDKGLLDEVNHLIMLANAFSKVGQTIEGEDYMKLALEIAEKNYGKYSNEHINALCAYGVFLRNSERYNDAIKKLSEALHYLTGTKQGKIFNEIGICYLNQGQDDLAFLELEKAMIIFKEHKSQPDIGKIYYLYGRYYAEDKLYSIKYLKKAFKIYKEVYGEDHRETKSVKKTLDERLILTNN
ncbi:hypothetical protein SteCoe_31155 [Stentor coeruleus]|uniref:AAA+ ATPase domain-containing protein n=1 Tax=Stentor coeruleus TaxID=5963 RepID=A0A1R2B270_9CILI|nr:hypothetical protein SteCoe_31155 [Stentor coeruleus]